MINIDFALSLVTKWKVYEGVFWIFLDGSLCTACASEKSARSDQLESHGPSWRMCLCTSFYHPMRFSSFLVRRIIALETFGYVMVFGPTCGGWDFYILSLENCPRSVSCAIRSTEIGSIDFTAPETSTHGSGHLFRQSHPEGATTERVLQGREFQGPWNSAPALSGVFFILPWGFLTSHGGWQNQLSWTRPKPCNEFDKERVGPQHCSVRGFLLVDCSLHNRTNAWLLQTVFC